MKKLFEMTQEDQAEHDAWVESRPPVVKEIARKLDPQYCYLLKTSNQFVTMYSISENGTVTVNVLAALNPGLDFERQVFGVDPDDLQAVDVPGHFDPERKPLLTDRQDVKDYCDMLAKANGLRQ